MTLFWYDADEFERAICGRFELVFGVGWNIGIIAGFSDLDVAFHQKRSLAFEHVVDVRPGMRMFGGMSTRFDLQDAHDM